MLFLACRNITIIEKRKEVLNYLRAFWDKYSSNKAKSYFWGFSKNTKNEENGVFLLFVSTISFSFIEI